MPGCGLRRGLYEFSLIQIMLLFTLAPGAATHCVICRVVCKDLPPGSHERLSNISSPRSTLLFSRTLHVVALNRWQRQIRAPLGPCEGLLKSKAGIKPQRLKLDELPKLSNSPLSVSARTISVWLMLTFAKPNRSHVYDSIERTHTLDQREKKMHYKIPPAECVENCGAKHKLFKYLNN